MSEFNDPELRQQLARLSGPYPDDNAAFDAWQRRVGQARRRRAVAWTTGAALSLLVGTVGVAALNNPGRHTLVPGKSADSSADVSTSSSSTTEAKDSSTTESTQPSTTESTVVETTPITEAIETSVPETEVEATEAAGDGSNSGPPKTHPPATSAAPAATPAASSDSTFPTPGGTITVRRDGDNLTVVARTPAGGFEVTENKQSGNRVEVTFESNDHRYTISVRIVNGVVTPTVSDKPKDHQDSVPGSTEEGGHGKGND